MGSKKKKVGKGEVPEKQAGSRQKTDHPVEDGEKKFDFGGLPERNLKKNLGC